MYLRVCSDNNGSLGCLLCNASMGYWTLSYLYLTMSTIPSAAEHPPLLGAGSWFERLCNLSSFVSFHKCCLIAASNALSFAPTTSPTFSPFLKSKKVGMARMPNSIATSFTSSTSTLKNLACGYSSLNLATLGAMTLQGPHQVAKQSRTTSVEASAPRISDS